jgi:methylmalonyl-CoA/ethylmalonyl-CoA epimerase
MNKRIDHIAVAVENLEEALRFYESVLGLPCLGVETVAEQGVRVAKLDTGNTHIELLEPLGPDTPVGKFLAAKGPGLHHLCFGVDNIDSELASLKAAQTRLIDQQSRIGAGGAKIAFVHPKATGGVLMELSEWPEED